MNEMLDVQTLRSRMSSQGLTQAQLVRQSGISRSQLSKLLSGQTKMVREATADRLAAAMNVRRSDLVVGGHLQDYRESIAKEHEKLDFRGIGMPQFRQQPIDQIFIDVTVCEVVDPSEECRIAGRESGQRRPVPPVSATECLRTQDRVVVLGHPGSGKTTLLRYLAHSSATQGSEQTELPIYIRLAEFARAQEMDDRVDVVKFVGARAEGRGCVGIEDSIRKELSDPKRRCLVLLDGLDEVGSHEQSERLTKAVKAFIEQYPTNSFVIASRVVGFESGAWTDIGFSVFRVLGYNTKQLGKFAEKWAKLLSRVQDQPESVVLEDLTAAIFANPRVRAMASNPLILTILVLLSGARGGTLPRRRVDLYEKVVDVFLDTWEKSKRGTDGFDETYSISLDAREFRWLLSDVALAMQKAERTLAPRWWLAEKMRHYLQEKLGFDLDEANDVCNRIIRYLAERTGLLEERGLDLFGFSHRTLQEYFASLGVIDEADASHSRDVTDCLRDYLFHPQWCEPVRLVAAQLTPPLAESLVSAIVDDPDPVGRFLKRAPLLALKCLSDGTSIANRRLVSGIFKSLVDLGRSRWLGITLEAFDALEDLEGTRLESEAKKAIEAILSMAKAELPGDDYGCLRLHFRLMTEIFEEADDQLLGGFESEAAKEVSVPIDGNPHKIEIINAEMRLDRPDAWHESACSILENENQSNELKLALVRELGRRTTTDQRSRIRLRKMLVSNASVSLRVASALALASACEGRHGTGRLLARMFFDEDVNDRVRAACAAGLEGVLPQDDALTCKMVQFLEGEHPDEVRAGVAKALSEVAKDNQEVTDALLRHANNESDADKLRRSCAWALEPQIGQKDIITRAFKVWLASPKPSILRQVAAQSLACAMASEKIAWDNAVTENAEHVLMDIENPCPCALEGLEELATARAVRGGLRLEMILGESLKAVGDQIELAFIFGSTARNRQTQESDIDVFLIGEITLKDLSSPLRNAENTLGRRINPVIYTRKSFREKYRAGDPFVLDVYRREKIPVSQPGITLSGKDVNDELRAMVAVQLASTV